MLRYTLYPVAPETADQLKIILPGVIDIAVTFVGAGGTTNSVVTETYEDFELSPLLLYADT